MPPRRRPGIMPPGVPGSAAVAVAVKAVVARAPRPAAHGLTPTTHARAWPGAMSATSSREEHARTHGDSIRPTNQLSTKYSKDQPAIQPGSQAARRSGSQAVRQPGGQAVREAVRQPGGQAGGQAARRQSAQHPLTSHIQPGNRGRGLTSRGGRSSRHQRLSCGQ